MLKNDGNLANKEEVLNEIKTTVLITSSKQKSCEKCNYYLSRIRFFKQH